MKTEKLLFLVFFFFMTIFQAQDVIVKDSTLKGEFSTLYYTRTTTGKEAISLGNKMLKISKNENELAKSYQRIADGYFRNGNFSKFISLSQKADTIFLKQNKYEDHFMTHYKMAIAYNASGLRNKAYEELKNVKKIAIKLKDPSAKVMCLMTEQSFFIDEKRYAEIIPVSIDIIEQLDQIQEKKYHKETEELISLERAILAYNYLKINKYKEAQKEMKQFDEIRKKIKLDDTRGESVYFLCKAMIYGMGRKYDSARVFFNKAEEKPRRDKKQLVILTILEERLKYPVDDDNKKSELFKEYSQIQDSINLQNKNTIALNSSQQNKNISQQKEEKIYFIITSSVLLILLVIIIFLYTRRQKKLYQNFREVIDSYENTEVSTHTIPETIVRDNEDNHSEKNRLISEEKEKDLLERLKNFEDGTDFTAHGFSLKNLNVILDTNSKYTNYILKTYRGKSFSDYVNGLKIKFIIQYLREDPEHLKYKINYLSEISGFNTHSHFTKVFTNETQISPSKFISMLRKENLN